MAIENGVIVEGSSLGGELFTFFGIGKDDNGMYNWGAIPYSSLINPKSKHKPVDYQDEAKVIINGIVFSRRTQLNEEQRQSVNYGHDFVEYNSALAAIRGVAAGTNFPYRRPSSWFRPADLWGYDHNAGNWFETNINKKTSISLTQGVTAHIQLGKLTDIFNLGALEGLNVYNSNFGFLMWNGDFSPSQPQVYFLCLSNSAIAGQQIIDILDDMQFSTANLALGTWSMYPVITTEQFSKDSFNYIRDEETGGKWFPFPFCNTFKLSVVQYGGDSDILNKYVIFEGGDADVQIIDYSSLTYKMYQCGISFTNTADVSYEINGAWDVSNAYNHYNKPNGTFTVILAANSTTYVELYSAKTEDDAYRFSVGTTPITINISYWMENDNGTEEGNGSIEVE